MNLAYPSSELTIECLIEFAHSFINHSDLSSSEPILCLPFWNNPFLLSEEILALYPVEITSQMYTIVVYCDKWQLMCRSPLDVVNDWLRQFQFDYSRFCLLFEGFEKMQKYYTPASDSNYSLMPIGTAKDKRTTWINAHQIQKIQESKYITRVQLLNGLSLPTIKKEYSLKKNIRSAVITAHFLKEADSLWYGFKNQHKYLQPEKLNLSCKSLASILVNQEDFLFSSEEITTLQQKIVEQRQQLLLK